jgi:hypothetical protein
LFPPSHSSRPADLISHVPKSEPYSHCLQVGSHSHLHGLSPCGSYCPACLTLPRRAPIVEAFRSLGRNYSGGSCRPIGLTLLIRTPVGETCRHHERDLLAEHHAPRPNLFAGLAQSFLALIAALASVIWPAIPPFFSHKGTLHSLTEWLFSCIHPRVLAPLLYRLDGTALSPLSPGGPTTTSNIEATFVFFDPWSPHHSLSRGGHPIPPRVHAGLEETSETEPLTTPPPINTIREWSQMLLTHTHEEFVTLAVLQKDHTCPPCPDVSGVALVRPSQIHHYVYGEWAIFAVSRGTTGLGFLSRYMCPEYWSILDPLEADLLEPPPMQIKFHRALRKSVTSRNLPILPLPVYRQLPRIAIQRDAPRSLWSCGTLAVSITLRLLLGSYPILSRSNLSLRRHAGPTQGPSRMAHTRNPPLTFGLGAASNMGSFPHGGHAEALMTA